MPTAAKVIKLNAVKGEDHEMKVVQVTPASAAYWDDDEWQWGWIAVGCVHRSGVSKKQAATYLLRDYWRDCMEEGELDHFHWINEEEYLSVAEV